MHRDSRKYLEYIFKQDSYSLADYFEEICDKFPQRPALIYTGCENFPEESITFSELDARSNQVANWAVAQGLKAKDSVALYMENRIEYVVTWLGFCKAGVSVAFINNSIKLNPLVHSIVISNAKKLVYGVDSSETINQVSEELTTKHNITCHCSGKESVFDKEILSFPRTRPSRSIRKGIVFTSNFGFVYTSGTTGLPKAVQVTHLKQWAFGAGYSFHGVNEHDVLYSSGMPLYHSSAGGIGTGFIMHYGCCQVLRKRFSATHWLSDVRRYKATIVQYIGELCRYVNNQPTLPDDANNTIKLATGNGLSKEIWAQFQTRFGIDKIVEFYGATEGNGAFKNAVSLKNILNGNLEGIGCIGRLNPKQQPPIRFVRYNIEEDDLERDNSGNLINCKPGEPGECLMPIKESSPITRFVGYTDPKASKKKLISDQGIDYVRTGDMLSFDSAGWVRFVDRIGDTFRWRGENVSTNEVASELSKCDCVAEINVYGVQVPHVEGRAGMAAVVFKTSNVHENLVKLAQHAKKSLPSYAIPLFVRIQEQTHTTGTFKHQKVALRKEGIDPAVVADQLVWLNPTNKSGYVPFTANEYDGLKNRVLQSKL